MPFSLPSMSRESTSPSQRLRQLKSRHADRHPKNERFSGLAHLKPEKSAGQFQSSHEQLVPFGQRHIFRSLYSFFFMEMSLFILWVAYRAFVHQTVWFDEGVAKAIVFGLPVFWFAARSKFISSQMGLEWEKLIPGLYLGLAVGGLYGFIGILSQLSGGRQVVEAALFASPQFWWLAFLALLTSWWESLFFFGLPVQYLRSLATWFSEWMIGAFTVVLFLLFHAPLRLMLSGTTSGFLVQMGVLSLFAVGQYLLYIKTKNLYCIVLSHLFWGLVIQVYAQ